MITEKQIWQIYRPLYISVLLLSILLSGCAATMVVTPLTEQLKNNGGLKIEGKIIYEGNKEYFPRTIIEDLASDPLYFYQYTYSVIYGRDNMHQAIPLFNPLTILGFPIGEDTLMISGKLDILKGKEVLKSYTATCGFNKSRNIFSEGETFSELRRRGLLAVRDNIETQMCQDKDFLLTLKPSD